MKIHGSALFLTILLSANVAQAAVINLNYCFNIQVIDHYQNCNASTSNTSEMMFPVYCDDSLRNINNLYVQLYDLDTSSSDDYIGTFIANQTNSTSQFCANFNWDQTAQSETYPDVYAQIFWAVGRTGVSGARSELCFADNDDDNDATTDNCTDVRAFNWRVHPYTDCGAFGSTCSQTLLIDTDVTSDPTKRAMVLKGMGEFEGAFGGSDYGRTDDTSIIWAAWDVANPSHQHCGNTGTCTHSHNWWTIHPNNGAVYRTYEVAPHEEGHVLQLQRLGIGSYNTWVFGAHSAFIPDDTETMATIEGFAEFIAARSWFNSKSLTVQPLIGLGGTFVDLESATPEFSGCANNNGTSEVQIAKAFWDLNDSHNEASVSPGSGNDTQDMSTPSVVNVWASFAAGSGNGDNKENNNPHSVFLSQTCNCFVTTDPDALNVRDYLAASPNNGDSNYQNTLLFHNNIQCQSDF